MTDMITLAQAIMQALFSLQPLSSRLQLIKSRPANEGRACVSHSEAIDTVSQKHGLNLAEILRVPLPSISTNSESVADTCRNDDLCVALEPDSTINSA